MIKLIFIVMLLSGCSSVPKLINESNYVVDEMNMGSPLAALKSVELSEIELLKINHAATTYESFKSKWSVLLKDPDNLSRLSGEFQKDYAELKRAFISLEEIATLNWAKYSSENKIRLTEFLNHSRNLDKGVNEFYSQKRYLDAGKSALIIIATLLEIGVKVMK